MAYQLFKRKYFESYSVKFEKMIILRVPFTDIEIYVVKRVKND